MPGHDPPPEALAARVADLIRKQPAAWRRTTGGYTTAERWIATFEDGTSVFVKSGADHLARFLRAEHGRIYSRIEASFLPRLVAWDDDGTTPILVLEDLSAAHWPPPWSKQRIEAVLATLNNLQALNEQLDVIPPIDAAPLRDGWPTIAGDPSPFLGLELCSARWLSNALPHLVQAAVAAPVEGEDILHFDVRSDNLCFVQIGNEERAILVDWNHSCRGNRELDIAGWLPSLRSEGGPLPEDVQTLDANWPALIAGYFAAHAGLPPIAAAPAVRSVQLSQLRAALPWAVRALGLPPLDGPAAP